MAVRQHLVDRSPSDVWTVLEDPDLYSDWVVGTSGSRPYEGHWPELGSSLAYRLRVGPKTLEARTIVRRVDRPRTLELEINAGPVGSARIAFDVRSWGDRTLVIVDEHPLRGLGGALHNAVLDWALQIRHRAMLARLARVVERETPARDPVTASDGPGASGTAHAAASSGPGSRARARSGREAPGAGT